MFVTINDLEGGRCFEVANQDKVQITAALSTTYKGLVLGNKVKSDENLIVYECSYSTPIAVVTATALGLMIGTGTEDVTTVAALGPFNCLAGGYTGDNVWVSNDCTLPGTPTLRKLLTTAWAEATTAGTLGQPNVVPIKYCIPPGGFIAFYSYAANATADFIFSFSFLRVRRNG